MKIIGDMFNLPTTQQTMEDAVKQLTTVKQVKSGRWLSCPKFLHRPREIWGYNQQAFEVHSEDVEIKKMKVNAVSVEENLQIQKLIAKISG